MVSTRPLFVYFHSFHTMHRLQRDSNTKDITLTARPPPPQPKTKNVAPINYFRHGREPWSSGYGRRLISRRSWVQIPAQYTGWKFFTYMCCKNCNDVCLNRAKTIKHIFNFLSWFKSHPVHSIVLFISRCYSNLLGLKGQEHVSVSAFDVLVVAWLLCRLPRTNTTKLVCHTWWTNSLP